MISFRPYTTCYLYQLIEVVKCSDLFLLADDNKLFQIIWTKQDSSLLLYDIDAMFNWRPYEILSKEVDLH